MFIGTDTIVDPDPIMNMDVITDATCNGVCDGIASVTPTGGTAPYTFVWSHNGATTSTVSGLCAGALSADITDANNCILLDTVTVTQPDTFQTTAINTNVSCFGGNDGTGTALPQGGLLPYNYAWNPLGSTDSIATSLTAGTYILTITDGGNCTDTASITVTEPPTPLTTTMDSTALFCNGDGSGTVNFTATADNATSYTFYYDGIGKTSPAGKATFNFSNLGLNTYTINVVASGTGGVTSSKVIQVEVLSTYAAPADLITMLTNDSTQKWRIKSEAQGHFGVGPADETYPIWYEAAAGEKSITGMYDDAYVFNVDGSITYVTNRLNDDPTTDVSGTIFGQQAPMDQELGNNGSVANPGGEYENYPIDDFEGVWALTAPNEQETITLSGNGFFGFYVGGNHTYEIITRSATEMMLKTIGADGLAWFVVLTNQDEVSNTLVTQYTNLVWEDDFNTDGAPNAANWTYDLGTGSNGWGNGELQTYTNNAENAKVEGGSLIITAKADGSGGYTSARLKSQGLRKFTYGRIEVKAKLPAAAGTWPAIWMLGSNFPTVGWPSCGEIDIMEQKGDDKNTTLGTCHWLDAASSSNASYGETTAVANADSEFHLYTVEWTDASIKIYLDDAPFYELANSASLPFNADFFLILNVAMGGTLGGTVDAAFTEDTMEIDYVKVFQ